MAKIAGGSAGTSGLTRHLMNNTLAPEPSILAAYYGRGAVIDTEMLEAARAIADGDLTFSESLDRMMSNYLSSGRDTESIGLHEKRTSERLAALTARILADRDNNTETLKAPVAVIRPDIHPLAAQGLGIRAGDILAPGEIDALLAGRRSDNKPIEGKAYAKERRLPVNPRTGADKRSMPIGSFDFTVTPAKSVSVAWAFSNDLERAKIFDAHIEASREAIGYLTDKLAQARIGAGGRGGTEAGHVAVLEFTHHTSRRVTQTIEDGVSHVTIDQAAAGDPDLHTHHLVVNAVFTESGRVGSLDTAAIRGLRVEADALYHARLAERLRNGGFDVVLDQRTGSAKMLAVPDAVNLLFSKRTNMGEALARKAAAEQGQDWDALSPSERATRVHTATQHWEQKEKGGKDDVANVADWHRQATEIGWQPPQSFLAYGPPAPERDIAIRRREAFEIAIEQLEGRLEQKAVITHHDLRVAAFQGLIHAGNAGGIADADAVTRIMREEGVKQYGEQTALLWGQEADKRHVSVTTELHEAQETEFISLARVAAEDRSGAIPARLLADKIAASGLDFTDAHGKAQRAAIERIGTGGRFGIIIGAAGMGKTTALKPLVAAWQDQGRAVYGASLAWRQADALIEAGIPKHGLKAFSVLIDGLKDGSIRMPARSVVAVDELALLGTRQGLELLRLSEKHPFQVVALADDKQLVSIEAGAIVDLCRSALGADQIPEILTTKRQQSERERDSVALLREGRAAEYLAMKRADGTAEMVPGRADDVIARTAQLYGERLLAAGEAPSIAAPTNADAHRIGQAVRLERRRLGQLGRDVQIAKATDGEREYSLALARGDRVRLFKSVGADYGNGKGGPIGRNGSVLDVIDVADTGITLRASTGQAGHVSWEKLEDPKSGRLLLGYGDCQTIYTAQGSTASEHITALPNGSKEIGAGAGYSTGTRHRQASYLLTNAMSEYIEIKATRPRNDVRPVTDADRWANVAEHLANREKKELASTLRTRTGGLRRGTVQYFHHALQPAAHRISLGQTPSDAPEIAQRRQVERSPVMRQMLESARGLQQRAAQRVRQVVEHVRWPSHNHYQGPSLGR